MPVPSTIAELSVNPSENSPLGSESPTTADNYFRAHAAFIKQVDEKADSVQINAAAAQVSADAAQITANAAQTNANGLRSDLAATPGATLVGSDDGAGGSLWASLDGFVLYAKDALAFNFRPQSYGAKADNVTDDRAAIQSAINAIRAKGGGILDLGSGRNYRISGPLRLCNNLQIVGSARILPTPGFSSSVVFPTFSTLLPQDYKCLAYFNEGTHTDDPGNFGYSGLAIAPSVIFDGQYHTESPVGLIVEGMTDYKIECQFTQFLTMGPWLKYYCWGGRLASYVTSCRVAFAKLGAASNGIDLNGFKGYGLADTPAHGLIIDGDNNGINLAGAFIEKVANQILWVGLSGPAAVSGIDFEVCSGTVITVDGTGLEGRQAGPVTVTGSFLEAGTSCVKAINAVVIVQGCRLRNSPLAFHAAGVDARIYEYGNVIESSVTTRAVGNVVSTDMIAASHTRKTRAPWDADLSVRASNTETVHAYSYNLALPTATMKYSSQLADPPTQRMLTAAEWSTNEMRNGAVYSTLGMRLDFLDGIKKIVPVSGGDTDLGTVSLPFKTVYATKLAQLSGVGVGVTPENNGEMVFQFESNTVFTVKARGADGVVRSGSIALA